MSKPYRKGDWWYIKLNGYEIKFVSYEEAHEYYNEHNEC